MLSAKKDLYGPQLTKMDVKKVAKSFGKTKLDETTTKKSHIATAELQSRIDL